MLITDINDTPAPGLALRSLPWLHQATGSGLVEGGTYLISGGPAAGKSTLVIQVLGSLAAQGMKSLYLPTEQSFSDIKRTVDRILRPDDAVMDNLHLDFVDSLTALPRFFKQKILPPDGEYHGCRVIAVDSLQGGGLSSQASEKYRALIEFTHAAKNAGITSLLVNQITKGGEIAGPKALEHDIDAVLFLRRALRLHFLFVPKNRFGPVTIDPVVLEMTTRGLQESAHSAVQATTIRGFKGKGDGLTEAQASVSIPKYGSRPAVTAPYLPAKKIEQLLKTIGTISGIEALEASYDISCGIPGGNNQYTPVLDLPITVAIMASYLHQQVPGKALFVGEVDLTRQIRPPGRDMLVGLAATIVKSRPGEIRRVYVAQKAADELVEMRPVHGGPVVGEIVGILGVKDLEELVRELWPGVIGDEERETLGGFEPAGCIPAAGAEDLAS